MIQAPRGAETVVTRDGRGVDAREWRLTVEGELSEGAALAFAGLAFHHEGGNTVLVGPVRDQAELQGHLQRVSALGLTLLEATAVGPGAPRSHGTEPPDVRTRPSHARSDP